MSWPANKTPDFSTEGIIVRSFPYGDADLVLRIICRSEAKLSALAKRARNSGSKRFNTTLDIFDRGVFTLNPGRGSLMVVKDFIPRQTPKLIRTELDKLASASLLCESFDLLIKEGSGDGEICFNSLALGLEAIDESQDRKTTLRAVCFSLSNLLNICGFTAEQASASPSSKLLEELIGQVEQLAERELNSKKAVFDIVHMLRAAGT